MTKNAQVVYILALKYSHSLDNGMLCICACTYTRTHILSTWAESTAKSPGLTSQTSESGVGP